jgi:hypothetical protein
VDFHIPKPIRQNATGRLGLFRTILIEEKPMMVRDKFMKEALSTGPKHPTDNLEVEREFWKKVTYSPPLYGADVEVRRRTARHEKKTLSGMRLTLPIHTEGVNSPCVTMTSQPPSHALTPPF